MGHRVSCDNVLILEFKVSSMYLSPKVNLSLSLHTHRRNRALMRLTDFLRLPRNFSTTLVTLKLDASNYATSRQVPWAWHWVPPAFSGLFLYMIWYRKRVELYHLLCPFVGKCTRNSLLGHALRISSLAYNSIKWLFIQSIALFTSFCITWVISSRIEHLLF